MANLHRTCSECGKVLEGGPNQKTCSSNCRSARSRRLARGRKKQHEGQKLEGGQGALARMTDKTADEVKDIVRDVFKEELRPIVRDAITEDTLRAIRGMMALTPLMVEQIGADLVDEDPKTRQNAAALIARYGLGHPAAQPADLSGDKQIVVVFDGMVRPGSAPADADAVDVEELSPAVDESETRQCNGCDAVKPVAEFVGLSDRCRDCHEAMKARAEGMLDRSRDTSR